MSEHVLTSHLVFLNDYLLNLGFEGLYVLFLFCFLFYVVVVLIAAVVVFCYCCLLFCFVNVS